MSPRLNATLAAMRCEEVQVPPQQAAKSYHLNGDPVPPNLEEPMPWLLPVLLSGAVGGIVAVLVLALKASVA
jgi:hypothetical protein